PPESISSARRSTDGVDMSKHQRAFFELYVGAVSSGSISAWLQESADNSSWTANDTAGDFSGSTGVAATQTSITGQTTSSSIVTFEVRADQLTSGKRYCRLQVKETAGNSTPVCVFALGCDADFKPASASNGTHVATNGAQKIVT